LELYILKRDLELKEEAKELNNLLHLKTKILNIQIDPRAEQ
jgi:hypothetical protein